MGETVKSVRRRVMSCCFPGSFSFALVRGPLLGVFFSFYMAEICMYRILNESIKYGELPWYTTDALIMGVSFAEALGAPLISWLGQLRRRTAMMVWLLVSAALVLLLLAAPDVAAKAGTEFCNGNTGLIPLGLTTSSAVRLSLIVVVAIACVWARVGLWCHGIAYMDEHKEEGMSTQYGIMLVIRVVGLLMIPKMLPTELKLWVLLVGICAPMVLCVLQFLRIPENSPPAEGTAPVPLQGRGFVGSIGRVLSKKLVVAQMFGMGFIAAALWGFAWHESDILKTKYFVVETTNWMTTYSDILRYHIVVFAVLFFATRCKNELGVFSKVSAVKLAMLVSVMVIPIYLVLVLLFNCQSGEVAGLAGTTYTQPSCSQSCGCSAPWNEFTPICIPDQMTTYLSPCHAGCVRTDSFGGISFLESCACAPASGLRRATLGACAMEACAMPFELHKLVYLVAVILTLLALQAQGVTLLRAVDARDRSVALGLSLAVVALLTFVCGHAAFLAVRATNCAWFEGGRCLLQNSTFPVLVGSVSAGLAFFSAVISIVTWFLIRNQTEEKSPNGVARLEVE